jgi:hypothetical protein
VLSPIEFLRRSRAIDTGPLKPSQLSVLSVQECDLPDLRSDVLYGALDRFHSVAYPPPLEPSLRTHRGAFRDFLRYDCGGRMPARLTIPEASLNRFADLLGQPNNYMPVFFLQACPSLRPPSLLKNMLPPSGGTLNFRSASHLLTTGTSPKSQESCQPLGCESSQGCPASMLRATPRSNSHAARKPAPP